MNRVCLLPALACSRHVSPRLPQPSPAKHRRLAPLAQTPKSGKTLMKMPSPCLIVHLSDPCCRLLGWLGSLSTFSPRLARSRCQLLHSLARLCLTPHGSSRRQDLCIMPTARV
ncbi:hypothetical protein Micbo1qcDRAFT_39655 [Microdochium bolleyi]|uniref:Uncharacterized protein n=1 Tax=Microdochium bolleyi TaxID=196109 RepID=A0A136J9L9_9PEZI|nr:hypothetical protein Micbo1qcDRAFT_39655 [Microdochium bolleyi]